MLIGMAFFKLGIIQGNAPLKIYGWMAATGLIAGLILSYLFLKPSLKYNFEHYEVIKHKYFEIYEIQRFVRSIGVFGLIMLAFKSGFLKRVFSWMRPVGQMAFTNYLAQSVICAFIFYGFGMGKFGQLERYQLYYVVLTIWIIQIGWSHFWLKYFRYGPLEWLWRCLTYWKILTIKKPESRIAIS
jgi:uncharacterized protein